METEKNEAIALFRYGLISELLHTRLKHGDIRSKLKEKCHKRYQVSWQEEPLKVTFASVKRWLSIYRKNGLKGLYPQERSDKGISRSMDPLLSKRILSIKKSDSHLSIPKMIRILEDQGEVEKGKLTKSSVHRLLQYHQLSSRSPSDVPEKNQRLPFRYPNPMDMWVGDVMHSRYKVQDRKVYLIAFMDNATRTIMHAAYDYSEGALNLLRVLKEALLVRGVCKRIYVDHGSGYVDTRFARVCAHVGAHLFYAPVRDGAAKGCIERWWRTVRADFEHYLQAKDLLDLDTLNSLLWRWIDSTYHTEIHSSLDGQSPWQRYMSLLPGIEHRRIDPDFDFESLWRVRDTRKVSGDGVVKLHGFKFEVPLTIMESHIELRFLEETFPNDVEAWVNNKCHGLVNKVDLEVNASRKRWKPKPIETPEKSLQVDPLIRSRNVYDEQIQLKEE